MQLIIQRSMNSTGVRVRCEISMLYAMYGVVESAGIVIME